MVAAAGVRSRGWHVRALISCAALTAAVTLAPAALASGLVPDPDPNPDQAQPQPDPYQSTTSESTTPAAPAPTQTPAAPAATTAAPTQTPAPLLPTVHVSKPATQLPTAPPKVNPRPAVVATPTHVVEAATEAPAVRSTPERTETPVVVRPAVDKRPPTTKRPRPALPAPRQERHVVAHHATAAAPPETPLSFARTALLVRWPVAFAPSVEAVRPRQVSAGVALAVAAVVMLSGSFLAIAARQARR